MPERHQNEHQMRAHNNFCAAFISRFVQLSTLYYKSFECSSCSFFQKSQFQFWFHIYVAVFQKSQFWFWFHTYIAFSSKILVLGPGSIDNRIRNTVPGPVLKSFQFWFWATQLEPAVSASEPLVGFWL